MFLHGGWAHLIGNMLYLYVFGDNVEDNFGRARFLLFYLLCGIGATLAQVLVDPASTMPMIGASGAISGVLAAYLFLFPRNRVRVLMGFFFVYVSAWLVLGLWIATQLFAGYTDVFHREAHPEGGVAYFAHIGGFVTGVILVFVFRKRRPVLTDPSPWADKYSSKFF
jgi:membrane associated rhomboid family serine protease